MTISERIFEILQKKGMKQKEFSERTGIAQGAISDWKRKKTNPTSDKIMIICEVLEVTPEELLSGTESESVKSRKPDYIIVDKKSEIGIVYETYKQLDSQSRERLIGYMKALKDMSK